MYIVEAIHKRNISIFETEQYHRGPLTEFSDNSIKEAAKVS